MGRKLLSWSAVVLNGLWILFGLWVVVRFHPRLEARGGAYLVGYWIGVGIAACLLVGAPILGILAVFFGARLAERGAPSRPVDTIFE